MSLFVVKSVQRFMCTVVVPLLLPVLSLGFTKTQPVVKTNKGDFLKILAFISGVKARLHFMLGKRRKSEIKAG